MDLSVSLNIPAAAVQAALSDLDALGPNWLGSLESRHKAGQALLRLAPPEIRADSYGSNRMLMVAEYLLNSKSISNTNATQLAKLLYQIRDFADAYGEADLPQLSDLSWTQVRALMSVTNKNVRRTLQARCRDDGWTVKQLQDAIREVRQEKEPGKFALRDARAALDGIVTSCEVHVRDLDRWREVLDTNLESLADEQENAVSEKIVPLVAPATAALNAVLEKVTALRERLGEVAPTPQPQQRPPKRRPKGTH